MARSAHAYVRGNTAQFYQWLAQSPIASHIPQGPDVWICGDCHLGNLGPLANSRGDIEIQIRDFDQAVIGHPAHDLIRLGLSLATAARGSDLPGVATARMIESMVDGYVAALASPDIDNPAIEPQAVRTVRQRAMGRRWRHLAQEQIDDTEPTIPLGKKFWKLRAQEAKALRGAKLDPAITDRVLAAGQTETTPEARLVDAAYWVKGCSSLGLLRFAAIAAIAGKRGERHVLLDFKEATASVAPVAQGAIMPQDDAQRVVSAAQALSPHLGERMAAVNVLGRSMFVRELKPQDLKIEVDQFTKGQAVKAATYLAFVVGKAHARQMDEASRGEWRETLSRHRSSALDAPSWLWLAIVALAARHEEGYLEHCRRYALAGAPTAGVAP